MNTNRDWDNDKYRNAFITAFQRAHDQMRDHKYRKMDYLGKGWRKNASWRDEDHPLSAKHSEADRRDKERHDQERRLKSLHEQHGWGDEKDE